MLHIPIAGLIPAGFSVESAFGNDLVEMIVHAGPIVKFVLILLLVFSVVSWAIIFMKYRLLRRAKVQTAAFLDLFWESRDLKKIYKESEALDTSPVACLFRAGYAEFSRFSKLQASASELSHGQSDRIREGVSFEAGPLPTRQALMDNLERSLKKAAIDQNNRLERSLSFLATTGNTTPFIGLFGTVWGIMESFRGIGLKGSANLAVVAPGISEALIATAAGLAAAIPAVVAFNYFSQRVSVLQAEMDIFTTDFLSMVGRQFIRQLFPRKTTG
ncbi:MAG: MotA/TolQ/ExbB proton channel family protein [Deltaproteobacteria bacterium]|nr:MotA/TolQ/ExbB proton channel family protein [Deltaproteobacteria bacterium]OQX66214.1 MAG: Tol-Pal system subunit TolQ [Desulfococcus sp. 4484_242]